MQWRALVLGLLLLRLGLHGALWLVFGLGPSMGFYQRFPLSFGFQRLTGPAGPAPGPADPPGGPAGPAWLQPPGPGAAAAGRRRAPRRPRPGVCGPAHWGDVLGGRGRGPDEYERRYSGAFPPQLRARMRDLARGMFVFGYDNYMAHAFPQDELNPIDCGGRGPDRGDPSNLNINDVLGNYSLTLVDALDTLAIMGNASEFQKAVKLVISTVSFDKDSTVQVFEATIRVLGSLLSAHRIITDAKQPFGNMTIKDYDNELLHMAHDLAVRLLPAFENTKTGIPYPRVNLKTGVPPDSNNETCTAGAGSLLVEFGMLSRLLGDSTFEWVARRAVKALWSLRSSGTGLLGNVVNIQTGHWVGKQSGLGAGLDSFYEYLLKSYILFGEKEDLDMFNAAYHSIQSYLRRGYIRRRAVHEHSGRRAVRVPAPGSPALRGRGSASAASRHITGPDSVLRAQPASSLTGPPGLLAGQSLSGAHGGRSRRLVAGVSATWASVGGFPRRERPCAFGTCSRGQTGTAHVSPHSAVRAVTESPWTLTVRELRELACPI